MVGSLGENMNKEWKGGIQSYVYADIKVFLI